MAAAGDGDRGRARRARCSSRSRRTPRCCARRSSPRPWRGFSSTATRRPVSCGRSSATCRTCACSRSCTSAAQDCVEAPLIALVREGRRRRLPVRRRRRRRPGRQHGRDARRRLRAVARASELDAPVPDRRRDIAGATGRGTRRWSRTRATSASTSTPTRAATTARSRRRTSSAIGARVEGRRHERLVHRRAARHRRCR